MQREFAGITSHSGPGQSALLKAVSRMNPLLSSLPGWVEEWREEQRRAVRDVVDGFESGCSVVVLDAPTGSGKTLIAETVRRIQGIMGCVYICHSKSLQDQFVKDFPYAKVVKGRSNYLPESDLSRAMGVSCADCNKRPKDDSSCDWCVSVHRCPYEVAKHEGLSSPLTCLNTSYWLTECNGPGRFSGRDLVVIDECDTLEREAQGS